MKTMLQYPIENVDLVKKAMSLFNTVLFRNWVGKPKCTIETEKYVALLWIESDDTKASELIEAFILGFYEAKNA